MVAGAGRSFSAGDAVILESTGECGVVVHAWVADELGGLEDCYVAFFGPEFPAQGRVPAQRPYVLRYAASSLRRRHGSARGC
jgi:hypothetical protein